MTSARTRPALRPAVDETRSRARVVAIGMAVLMAAAGVCVAASWVRGLWAEPPVPTYVVNTRLFVRKVATEGNLRAVKATPLLAPPRRHGVSKIAWLAADGSWVDKGDPVARFDATVMEKQLADGQSAFDTAQKKLAKQRIETGSLLADRDRDREMSQLELDMTRKFQRKNDLIFSKNEIIQSEIDEELSQAKLEHADASKTIEGSLSRRKRDLLNIERRSAEQKVTQAEQALQELVLTAPHAGIVVLKRDWRGNEIRVGDQVWPGQPIAEIPHTESMEAEVFVLEADAGGLEEGRPAEMTIEAHPETIYKAKIKRVDKLAKPRVRGVPVQYFGVVLELQETDTKTMKQGQRIRATLSLDEREALVVPRPAIFERDDDSVVYRQAESGGFKPVKVTLGPSSLGLVVIEDGLSPGDRIALRDPTRSRTDKADSDQREDSSHGTAANRGVK